MGKLVTIDDKQIRNMVNDQRFLAAFPCLQGGNKLLQQSPRLCGRCMKKRQTAINGAMTAMRTCIGTLDQTSRNTLKKLLNANQVRVSFRNTRNQTIVLTF